MTAFAIAALSLAPAVAGAQATATDKSAQATAPQKVDDSTLDSRIEKRIKADASLKKDDIDVAVDNGVVTLSGKVHSKAQRAHAEKLARITGVTRVENKLEVEAAATSGVAEKTGKATDKAVDKTKTGASDAGEAITDAWITTKVKTEFVGVDALKGSDINVDTVDHVVTLKGTVASAAGRARAMEIAKTTKGVTRVVDNLTIAPKK
jgi:osmotically-inducible protein OsmY